VRAQLWVCTHACIHRVCVHIQGVRAQTISVQKSVHVQGVCARMIRVHKGMHRQGACAQMMRR